MTGDTTQASLKFEEPANGGKCGSYRTRLVADLTDEGQGYHGKSSENFE